MNQDQELEKRLRPENFTHWCDACGGGCDKQGGLEPCCGCHIIDEIEPDMYNYVDIQTS